MKNEMIVDDELSTHHAKPTFPLALRPVSQIVAPFCESNSVRSMAVTEPGERINGQVNNRSLNRPQTWVKSYIRCHWFDVNYSQPEM